MAAIAPPFRRSVRSALALVHGAATAVLFLRVFPFWSAFEFVRYVWTNGGLYAGDHYFGYNWATVTYINAMYAPFFAVIPIVWLQVGTLCPIVRHRMVLAGFRGACVFFLCTAILLIVTEIVSGWQSEGTDLLREILQDRRGVLFSAFAAVLTLGVALWLKFRPSLFIQAVRLPIFLRAAFIIGGAVIAYEYRRIQPIGSWFAMGICLLYTIEVGLLLILASTSPETKPACHAWLCYWLPTSEVSLANTKPTCTYCGYDLRAATTNRCPECGTEINPV